MRIIKASLVPKNPFIQSQAQRHGKILSVEITLDKKSAIYAKKTHEVRV